MTRRRLVWVVLGLVVLAAGAAAAVFLDPGRTVRGWWAGEPFHSGRAASAWARDLAADDEVKAVATRDVLVKSIEAGAEPVCEWVLQHAPQPAARWRAAEALGALGKPAESAGPALVAALADPDPLVRGTVARVVGELTPDPGAAVPALVKLFPNVDAIRAAARYKAAAGPAVPRLTELLRHDDPAVRWQAGRALGKIGEPALPALPELVRQMAADPDPLVREHAAEALGDIGPAAAAAVPDLAKALKDPAPKVRRDAVRGLGQMGPAARPVLAEVAALANDPEEVVREAAARAARQIDPGGVRK